MIGTSNTLKYSYIFYRKALNKRPGAYSLFAPLGWRFFEEGRGAYPGGGVNMLDNLYEFCTSKWALFKHSWRVFVCLFNELDFDLKSLESIFSCILAKKFRLDR